MSSHPPLTTASLISGRTICLDLREDIASLKSLGGREIEPLHEAFEGRGALYNSETINPSRNIPKMRNLYSAEVLALGEVSKTMAQSSRETDDPYIHVRNIENEHQREVIRHVLTRSLLIRSFTRSLSLDNTGRRPYHGFSLWEQPWRVKRLVWRKPSFFGSNNMFWASVRVSGMEVSMGLRILNRA